MNFVLASLSMVLGARHAVAPDHLAAVGTYTEKTEATRWQAIWYALRIAAGHSVGMLAVAAFMIVFLRVLPPIWVTWTSRGSGLWLLAMAVWILWDLIRDIKGLHHTTSRFSKCKMSPYWGRVLARPAAAWAIGLLFGLAVSPGDLAIFTIMIKSHATPVVAFGYLALFFSAMFIGLGAIGGGLGWANTRTFLRRTFQGVSGLAGVGVAIALLGGFLH